MPPRRIQKAIHQRRLRRLLGLAGRRHDLREVKDDAQDDHHARRHTPQCTSYNIRPLHPRDSGETTTSTLPHSCAPPLLVTIKGGGGLPLAGSLDATPRRYNASRRDPSSLTLRHPYSPPSAPLLTESWEPSSLSRLACTPYYKHIGCKIIQSPRTPPLLDVRPHGRNQDKSCVTVLSLASSSGTRKHASFTSQVGERYVTFFSLVPFDLQGWRADPTHTLWVFRIRSQRDS